MNTTNDQRPHLVQNNNPTSLLVQSAKSTPAERAAALLDDPIFAAVHNAFLLGWSLTELKSRIQIAACNLSLDVYQQGNTLIASILNASPANGDPAQFQPDIIDSLLRDIVLKDVEVSIKNTYVPREVEPASKQNTAQTPAGTAPALQIPPETEVTPSKKLSSPAPSLATELRDNEWLTSRLRSLFGRVVARHVLRFPYSDTTGTMYDIHPPTSDDKSVPPPGYSGNTGGGSDGSYSQAPSSGYPTNPPDGSSPPSSSGYSTSPGGGGTTPPSGSGYAGTPTDSNYGPTPSPGYSNPATGGGYAPPSTSHDDEEPFPYGYLYPGKFDYADIGIRIKKIKEKSITIDISAFSKRFRLYDVTRRALNCLTLLMTNPKESLEPVTVACYQKRLVPKVLAAQPVSTHGLPTHSEQAAFDELSCDELPTPSDEQIKVAIKTLSNVVVRLLEAWDGFLRESFYVATDDADDSVNADSDISSDTALNNSSIHEIELNAYEAGRALAAISWNISVATAPLESAFTIAQLEKSPFTPAILKKIQMVWLNTFNDRDINRVEYQITALSTALDEAYYRVNTNFKPPDPNDPLAPLRPDLPSQAIQAVKHSLNFWQRGVMWINNRKDRPLLTPLSTEVQMQQVIDVSEQFLSWDAVKRLRSALIEQSTVWQSLLLYQQGLQSFTLDVVTHKILSEFMQQLEQAAAAAGKEFIRTRRRTLWGIVVIGCILLLLVALDAVLAHLNLLTSQISSPLTILVVLGTGVAAIVSPIVGRLGQLGNNIFSPASTTLTESFQHGLTRVQIEFDYLDHYVAVTYPLIEFFTLEEMQPVDHAIKDGYDFLIHVFWTDSERKEELDRITRAAFGPIGAFVGAHLNFSNTNAKPKANGSSAQNAKSSALPTGTQVSES